MKRLLLRHPFELCLAVALLLAGTQSISRAEALSEIVDTLLTRTLVMAWQGGVILGALSVLLSLLLDARGRKSGPGMSARLRTLEQVGLILMAMSCFCYAVVIMLVTGLGGVFSVGIVGAVGSACVLRTIALRGEGIEVLHSLRSLNEWDQQTRDAN